MRQCSKFINIHIFYKTYFIRTEDESVMLCKCSNLTKYIIGNRYDLFVEQYHVSHLIIKKNRFCMTLLNNANYLWCWKILHVL